MALSAVEHGRKVHVSKSMIVLKQAATHWVSCVDPKPTAFLLTERWWAWRWLSMVMSSATPLIWASNCHAWARAVVLM